MTKIIGFYDFFAKKNGKTYVINEILKTSKKKILVINFDFNIKENIFNILKYNYTYEKTLSDILLQLQYIKKMQLNKEIFFDDVYKAIEHIHDNLDILSVSTSTNIMEQTVYSLEYRNLANKMENTNINKKENTLYFLYILEILNKSNYWDYIFLDTSQYTSLNIIKNICDFNIYIYSKINISKILYSNKNINNLKNKIDSFDIYKDKILLNNFKNEDYENVLELFGIEQDNIMFLGNIERNNKLFNCKKQKNIENILEKI